MKTQKPMTGFAKLLMLFTLMAENCTYKGKRENRGQVTEDGVFLIPPHLVCSSAGNIVLSALEGEGPDKFIKTGCVPPTVYLVKKPEGKHVFVDRRDGRKYPYRSYRRSWDKIGFLKWSNIRSRKDEIPTLCIGFQSTYIPPNPKAKTAKKRRGYWRWGHHVIFVLKCPVTGNIYRAAADGYRSKRTGFSLTPFYFDEVKPGQRKREKIELYGYNGDFSKMADFQLEVRN